MQWVEHIRFRSIAAGLQHYCSPKEDLFWQVPAPRGSCMDLCWVQNAATEEIMYLYPKPPRSFSSAEFLVEVAAKAGTNLAEVDQLCDTPGMVRVGWLVSVFS